MKRLWLIIGILCCLSAVFAQQKKYSARVFDGITYQPLSGASVYNMNTQKFAFTDKNGRFAIDLSLNDTLIISKSTYRQHVAVIDKKLSSAVGFRGICKKVLILMLVGVAHIIDLHVVGTGSALRGAVICFYMSNEGLSLLENAAHIGLPIPDKLRDILAQLHDKERTTDQGDGE